MREKNVEIFQLKFNKLEQLLRTRYFDGDMNTSIIKLIERKGKVDIFDEHFSHFKALKNLRNNIAHGDREEYFAVPTDKTIELLTSLLDVFENPPLIGSLQLHKPLTANYYEDISDVVAQMINSDYSQVPVVRDNNIVGIMTLESILKAMWVNNVGVKRSNRIGNIENLCIHLHGFRIVDSAANAADVIKLFDDSERNGEPLLTILVSNSGEVVGILTPYDIVDIYKKVKIVK